MLVIGYIRVSTMEQAERFGIVRQEAVIKGFSKEYLNCDNPKMIGHIVSGHKVDYSALLELTDSHIVVDEVSRFSRSVERGIEYIKRIVHSNTRNMVHFVAENLSLSPESIEKNTNEFKKFVRYLRMAKKESEIISHRIKTAKRASKANGIYVGGNIPYGLKIVNNKYIKVKDQLDIIKFIKLARSKNYTAKSLSHLMKKISGYPEKIVLDKKKIEPLTYINIADILNEYEVTYRDGKPFTVSIVRSININNINNYLGKKPIPYDNELGRRHRTKNNYTIDIESDHFQEDEESMGCEYDYDTISSDDDDDELYAEFGNLSV